VLPPLLDAAFQRLCHGFPITTIKIVVFGEGSLAEAITVFSKHAAKLSISKGASAKHRARIGSGASKQGSSVKSRPAKKESTKYDYDVFISYSRKNEASAKHLYQHLVGAKLRVFMDRMDIRIGDAWQQEIYDALDSCRVTAVLYSPAYLKSKVCKEELNIALMRRRDSEQETLFPLLIEKADLPTYMRMLNYADCRINDKPKIAQAAKRLAEEFWVKDGRKVAAATH
jgi:hypothetical protein